MSRALYMLAGYATAPGAAGVAPSIVTGGSTTIPNCPFEKRIDWVSAWADSQGVGMLQVKSPKLHDAQNGVQLVSSVSQVLPLWPTGYKQRVYPQDLLTINLSGSATAGDIESFVMLFHFEEFPGVAQRLIDINQLNQFGVNLASLKFTLALGTTGGLSGEEGMNADQAHLKANTDYAILGADFDVECTAVCLRGPDTGHLRLPIPGDDTNKSYTARWFMELTEKLGMGCIPVINSANLPASYLDGIQDENGADPTVSLYMVELSPASLQAIR